MPTSDLPSEDEEEEEEEAARISKPGQSLFGMHSFSRLVTNTKLVR